MGRFGPLDGLLMLGLQLVLAGLLAWLGRGHQQASVMRWLAALLCSFACAFIAHIILLNLLKHGLVDVYNAVWLRRGIVALAWGGATAGGLKLVFKDADPPMLWLGGLGGAAAYLIFALLRT